MEILKIFEIMVFSLMVGEFAHDRYPSSPCTGMRHCRYRSRGGFDNWESMNVKWKVKGP
jgi:hypothetical protein